MTNKDGQLRNIRTRRRRTKTATANTAVRLGDTIKKLMDGHISPRQQKFQSITQLWNQLLPAELARHCRIVDVSGGELKVKVDSPSYSHELRWCSSGILKQLQQNCPGAGIKRIKSVLS